MLSVVDSELAKRYTGVPECECGEEGFRKVRCSNVKMEEKEMARRVLESLYGCTARILALRCRRWHRLILYIGFAKRTIVCGSSRILPKRRLNRVNALRVRCRGNRGIRDRLYRETRNLWWLIPTEMLPLRIAALRLGFRGRMSLLNCPMVLNALGMPKWYIWEGVLDYDRGDYGTGLGICV